MKNNFKLVLSLLISLAAGFIGSIFTVTGVDSWYANLLKPAFNPPNWLFGPVWTTLYILMGIALYLVWQKGIKKTEVGESVGLFVIQLVFNVFWSAVFFGLQSPGMAIFVIVLLWSMILMLIFRFYKISKAAAYLLIPYLMWVSFATILNISIFLLN